MATHLAGEAKAESRETSLAPCRCGRGWIPAPYRVRGRLFAGMTEVGDLGHRRGRAESTERGELSRKTRAAGAADRRLEAAATGSAGPPGRPSQGSPLWPCISGRTSASARAARPAPRREGRPVSDGRPSRSGPPRGLLATPEGVLVSRPSARFLERASAA